MKKFTTYFESIGLTDNFLALAEKYSEIYINIYGDDIKDCFVSEYLDSNGTKNYENIWFFSDNFVCESKSFLFAAPTYDTASIKNLISHWISSVENYELDRATLDARMTLEFTMSTHTKAFLRGSGVNCEHLVKILKTYVIPNLI